MEMPQAARFRRARSTSAGMRSTAMTWPKGSSSPPTAAHRQDRGLIAGAGADLEDALVAAEGQCQGHPSDHGRLRDGLVVADGRGRCFRRRGGAVGAIRKARGGWPAWRGQQGCLPRLMRAGRTGGCGRFRRRGSSDRFPTRAYGGPVPDCTEGLWVRPAMGSGRVWHPPMRLVVQGWNRVFHGCTGFTGWGFAWFAVSLLILVSVAGLRFVVDWGRQDLCIVVSVRPGWARNYFTYFFVYSARCCDAPARGLGQSRGHQWGGRR